MVCLRQLEKEVLCPSLDVAEPGGIPLEGAAVGHG